MTSLGAALRVLSAILMMKIRRLVTSREFFRHYSRVITLTVTPIFTPEIELLKGNRKNEWQKLCTQQKSP
jgi:hypothetical protein